jgi:hypothetical protein
MNTADGSVYALKLSRDEIEFSPYFSEIPPQVLTGHAFQFSPNGEAIAIWNDNKLEIYLFQNAICECWYFGMQNPQLTLVYSIAFDDPDSYTTLRWSMDGTTIAYANQEGVWVLDLFRQSEPTLLIEGFGSSPFSLFTTGRFIAFGNENDQWVLFDRLTSQSYDNAMLSPDERQIVYVDPTGMRERHEAEYCRMPVSESCYSVFAASELRDLVWVSDSMGVALVCDQSGCLFGSVPQLYQDSFDAPMYLSSFRMPYLDAPSEITDFVYDPLGQVYAAAMQEIPGQSQLVIYGSGGGRETTRIPGQIVDMRWMDSFFYFRYED